MRLLSLATGVSCNRSRRPTSGPTHGAPPRSQKSKSCLIYVLELAVMELRQLEYFVTVAEEASFTKAAAKVHVAQPGVSAQVRRLERELGQDLLDRSGRTVRLTEVGAAVLPYARAALGAVAGARLAVDELTGLVRGHVAVGMVVACSSLDLPATTPPGIEIQIVADEPLVAAVSHSDALAARTTITLQALRHRELISLPRGTGLRSSLDDACATAGFRPRIAFEASDPRVLAQLAGRGLGVAILPEAVAHAHPTELHAVAVTGPEMRGRLALAWRAEGPISPAARALISHARTVLAGPSADRQPSLRRETARLG